MDLGRAGELAGGALANLEAHARRINALNVYPVPDGDTGTNLLYTVRGVVAAVGTSSAASPAQLAEEVRRAALMEAKGNSGVIFSQIVRGLGEGLAGSERRDGAALARALREAATRAYQAVDEAVEGTMLTVIREMAEEAERPHVSSLTVEDALAAVLARGDDAVRRTPEVLPLLAEAGVVDAGGAGLVEIFRGLHAALTGAPLPDAPAALEDLSEEAIHQEPSRYRYCTVFTVEGAGLDRQALHERLEGLGDSLLVVGDEELLKVHVHTDAPEEALALGRAVGVVEMERAEIADMREQASHREDWLSQLRRATHAPPVETGLVAVVAGAGNRRVLEAERNGIFAIEGGQTMNPSVGEIHEAITALNAEHVIVMPNNPNIRLAAEEAAALSTKDVRVVATRSIPEGVAAVVAFDPDRDVATNEERLRETLAGVLAAEVTRGARDAVLDGVEIREGDWLGRVADRAVASGQDLWVVLDAVLAELLADGRSYLTVLRGDDAPSLDELRRHLARHRPELTDDDLQIIDGGQPHYPLLLSAE